jgi:hypothetical protein
VLQAVGHGRREDERNVVPKHLGNCSFCYHALYVSGKGGFCSCGEVAYCSKTCQRVDWRRHHKRNCAFHNGNMEEVN